MLDINQSLSSLSSFPFRQSNDLDDNVSVANEEGCNHDGDDVAGSLPCDLFSRWFRNEAFAGAGQARGHTLG